MSHRKYTIEELKQELTHTGAAQMDWIPTYMGRAIASGFNWTHNMPPFEEPDRRKKMKAFIKWRKLRVGSPQFGFDGILQAILQESLLLPNQIDRAQAAYDGPNKNNFDLRRDLGEFYMNLISVFVEFAEVVSAYQRGDFDEAEKHEERLQEMLSGELKYGNLCAALKDRIWALLSYFRQPIDSLRTIGLDALEALSLPVRPSLDIHLDAELDQRATSQFESERFVYYKPETLQNSLKHTLSQMMHNAVVHGDAQNLTLRFFGEYNGKPIQNNLGFSLSDDGKGFADVMCLSEKKPVLQFAKEYGNALVVVESRGKACWYVVSPYGVAPQPERETGYDKTCITLLLPVDNGYDFVWDRLRESFNEQELVTAHYDEAEIIRRRKRDNAEAIRKFEEVIKRVAGKTGPFSRNKVAQCLHRIGNCYVHKGDLQEAAFHHETAEKRLNELAEEGVIDPPEERWWLYNSRSVYYTDCYDFSTAEKYLKDSIAVKEMINEPHHSLAQNWGSLGQLYTFWGKYNEAEAVLQKAVNAMEMRFDHITRGVVILPNPDDLNEVIMDTARDRNYLALLYIKMGQFDEAEKHFKDNLRLIDEAPIAESKPYNLSYVYYGLSKLYYDWGLFTTDNAKFQQAIDHATESLYRSRALNPGALASKFKGCAHRELEQWDDAIAGFTESYTALESVPYKNLGVIAVSARLELAKLYLRCHQGRDLEAALAELEASLASLLAFDVESAQEYFKKSVKTLEEAIVQLQAGNIAGVATHIQKVIDKIPY
jgi:tetratricopeptide (TPR) repeat protein